MLRLAMLAQLVLLLLPLYSFGADPLVLVTNEYPPYVIRGEKQKGLYVELVQAAFAASGLTIEIRYYPWGRCASMVENGEAFAAFPYWETKNRRNFADFSDPLGIEKGVFFYMKHGKARGDISSLQDLKDYEVGGTVGFAHLEAFQAAGIAADIGPDSKSTFLKLAWGRVDYVPAGEYVGWHIVHTYLPEYASQIATTDWEWLAAPYRLMVSKQYHASKNLLAKFNAGFAAIRQNGTYDAIITEYGLPSDKE